MQWGVVMDKKIKNYESKVVYIEKSIFDDFQTSGKFDSKVIEQYLVILGSLFAKVGDGYCDHVLMSCFEEELVRE